MAKDKFKIYCDLDGVLVDYMGGVVPTMNEFIQRVSDNLNYYKTKYPKLYKAAKKAVQQLDGDLDNGILGMPVEEQYIAKDTDKKRVRDLMYTLISNDYSFWVSLDWMDDGKQLWRYISKYNPTILTGPQGPNSKKGKLDWCRRELGIGKDRVIITHTKHEVVKNALEEGKTAILIDDLPKYVVPFRNAGGYAIQHVDASTTIEQLKELGL